MRKSAVLAILELMLINSSLCILIFLNKLKVMQWSRSYRIYRYIFIRIYIYISSFPKYFFIQIWRNCILCNSTMNNEVRKNCKGFSIIMSFYASMLFYQFFLCYQYVSFLCCTELTQLDFKYLYLYVSLSLSLKKNLQYETFLI